MGATPARHSTTLRCHVYTISCCHGIRLADDTLKTYAHRRPADSRNPPGRLRARGPAGGAACRGTCAPRAHTRADRANPPPGRKLFAPEVAAALAARGIASPWTHQAQAAALARAGTPRDHRHTGRVGQVGGLPGRRAVRGARRRHRALHRAHQGTRRRPAQGGPRPGGARRPRHLLRRRLHGRRARLGAVARQLPADQPGHAAQRAAAEPRPLARLLPPPAGGDHRRVPRLPRRFRLARRAGAAPAAPRRRPPRARGATAVPARSPSSSWLRRRSPTRKTARGTHRAGRGRGDRGRLAPGAGHLRPVGAAAAARLRRGAGPQGGHVRGGGPARRAGQGRDPGAGLHPVAARRGDRRARRPRRARRGAVRQRRRLPLRLPARRPPRPRGGAARRADHRHGRHDRT